MIINVAPTLSIFKRIRIKLLCKHDVVPNTDIIDFIQMFGLKPIFVLIVHILDIVVRFIFIPSFFMEMTLQGIGKIDVTNFLQNYHIIFLFMRVVNEKLMLRKQKEHTSICQLFIMSGRQM